MNHEKILVVDDNESIRNICKDTLEVEKYLVEQAASGKLVLKLLSNSKYDLVLLDLKMPDIDGMTVMREIREKYNSTDVIIITAHPEVETVVNALRMGAYDYIVKPFVSAELIQSVKRCLETRRLSREVNESNRELKEAYDKLKKTKEQIIQTEKLRMAGEFASSIAHELRNPLGIISSTTQFVLSKIHPKGKFSEHLKVILRNAESATKKVQDFLDFARPAEVSPKPCSINKILDETCKFIETKCKKQKVTIKKNYSSDLPLIAVDGRHIQSAFLNFILNSLDTMREGGEIRFETDMDKHRENIIIRFTDTGCGIPEDRIKKLFDPFFTTKGNGTGLGLTIAQRVIEYYKGKITIESKERKGTTVSAYIPIALNPPK